MATKETAITQYAVAHGAKLAYHRLGLTSDIPLVMLVYFRGNMDFRDLALINRLALQQPILLLDNAGIGTISREIPVTPQGCTNYAIALLDVLHIDKFDLLGFYMGGVTSIPACQNN